MIKSGKGLGPKKSIADKKKPLNMPKMESPSDDVVAKFHAAIPEDKRIEQRKMFGYPCTFINGNMAVCVHGKHIIARFGERDIKEWLIDKKAVLFEPMPGRPMKEYIVVPNNIVENTEELKNVLVRSVNYVFTLKPKEKKKKK